MQVIEGGCGVPDEPDWSMVFSDTLDQERATTHWSRVIRELELAGTLAVVNGHQVERLVMLRVVHDRAARIVGDEGAVKPPRRGNPKAIARINPHFDVMRQAASDCDRIEAELGLSPRRRGSATPVQRGRRRGSARDEFLKPVSVG